MRLCLPQEPLGQLALLLIRLLPIARSQVRLEWEHLGRMPWLFHCILLAQSRYAFFASALALSHGGCSSGPFSHLFLLRQKYVCRRDDHVLTLTVNILIPETAVTSDVVQGLQGLLAACGLGEVVLLLQELFIAHGFVTDVKHVACMPLDVNWHILTVILLNIFFILISRREY